jgi:adenylyl-sulfate kinase
MVHEKPMTLWMTGLSASGKSTLAFGMEKKLLEAGRAVFVLDGDRLRNGLSRDLGFSPESRRENIRRVAEVARMMNDAGLVVLVSLISPMRADREMAREIIGDRFLEVYVKASLDVCVARDPKGLYKKALSGMIPEFTGVSAPYEEPERPDLVLETDSGTSEAVLGQLWDWTSDFLQP